MAKPNKQGGEIEEILIDEERFNVRE